MNYFDWKPEVGMKVYIMPRDIGRSAYKDTITKVGKKCFYVGTWNQKYDIDTKERVDRDYGGDKVCYRSEEDYKAHQAQKERRKTVEWNVSRLSDEQIDVVYEWIKDKL